MPNVKIKLAILSEVAWNALTGFQEGELDTNEQATQTRKQNILAACQTLLDSLVGPGDFLDSNVRSTFAKEAYYAPACSCRNNKTCLRDPSKFVDFNKDDLPEPEGPITIMKR